VVAQHGLEGRPQLLVDTTDQRAVNTYALFGARLAERGYIVWVPQNPYIFGERFRTVVRKANPLKLTLYSFIVAMHGRALEWLASLPFVDPKRIAFYGLSYGGKTAMRVGPLLDRYAAVICSGDFNEWIWKTTSVEQPFSYMFTHEHEIGEFNLANTFNYAELASLIAPRPFMVERGHGDGVGIDEWVAYEYAKVRRFYAALSVPEHTEIEFFVGGHKINGQRTYEFLDRHLGWRRPAAPSPPFYPRN
jgi:cephalosporin-C deacetylase-like acetyl esterase